MQKVEPRWNAGGTTTAALFLAVQLFATKARKGSDTPYISHLLAVSALVMEHGGSEVQAAAGLLHDTLEDIKISAHQLVAMLVEHGMPLSVAQAVVAIVEATTDGEPGERRDNHDWPQRKTAYLSSLREKSAHDPALLVSLADKVHNGEATVQVMRGGTTAAAFYAQPGFNAEAPLQKWYYSSLARVFRDKLGGNAQALPLVRRLEAAVDEIFANVGAATP